MTPALAFGHDFGREQARSLEGLIHVSELSEKRIEHPKEIVAEGDQVTLRIIKIDEKRRRIGLRSRPVQRV
ncbi:MAG: S1 RNA-binding domain-containing protein [Chloroflexi bacterium]|nr:S1 RNA-binding domain-containing protein [Chloroflexota bacterium]